MPTFPERVLEAYHRWRAQAEAHGFTPAQLPGDDALKLAAQDAQALNNPAAPQALKVWGGPLQRIRLMVATGFEEATRQPLEPAMFTPNLPGGVWPTPQGQQPPAQQIPHPQAPNHQPAAPQPPAQPQPQPPRRGADTMVDDILGLSDKRRAVEPTPLTQGLDDGSMWPAGNPQVGTAGPIPRATLRATPAPQPVLPADPATHPLPEAAQVAAPQPAQPAAPAMPAQPTQPAAPAAPAMPVAPPEALPTPSAEGAGAVVLPAAEDPAVAGLARPMDDVIVDHDLVASAAPAEEDTDVVRTVAADLRDYVETDFARLVMFGDSAPKPLADAVVEAVVQSDGSVLVRWEAPEPAAGVVRLYRVVSEEEEFDRDPDSGEHRATTVGTHWVDEDEFTTALRFYQVWAHEGATEAQARTTPPRFVGEAWIIRPVEDMTLTVAGREIKGQWSPLEGTTRVAVFAAKERDRRVHSPRNEISLNEANQQGFIFSPPQRGVNWKFVARRIVNLRGFDRYSLMSDVDMIAVPAEVHAVDIAVDTTALGDETLFDVSWDNPSSGEVRIYRTNVAPDDGVTGRTVDVRFLEDFGLPQENWVNDLTRGENSCRVSWPEDWYSIFLTPVTVVGEKCQVGRSYSSVRVGEVTNAALFERVTHQVATFGWPRNALEVAAYFVSQDPYTGSTSEEHLTTIDRETYDARGGMRLKLNDRGKIKLLPSKYYNNEKILGEPALLDYHGVTRMKYSIFGRGGAVCVAIAALRPEHTERRFTLRIQRGRLPLEAGDGLEVNVRQITHGAPHSEFLPGLIVDQLGPDQPTTYWEIDPRMLTKAGPNAFLRLFPLDLEDASGRAIALEDPPVAYLHLRRLRDIIAASAHAQAGEDS
ncbi:hypothetical protein C1Y63_10695 [Corynebacterium sp. 13CS0277]|uniref:hypothetical protein n=1 Tax=Corynebacterium sp. 13CS0277 TaxID=2071994 RepID=UPI000D02ECC7|nr:hypothetical protein [Corynebacterium sp. 13CS0277]PRQ10573.1 hypothetical protein C1Y63_10695 [Corynebacterium sp. 13CS0277]